METVFYNNIKSSKVITCNKITSLISTDKRYQTVNTVRNTGSDKPSSLTAEEFQCFKLYFSSVVKAVWTQLTSQSAQWRMNLFSLN